VLSKVALRPDRPLLVALEWVERHCVIPDGFRKGEPFNLYEWQLRYFAAFYSVRGDMPDQDMARPVLAPAFRFRRGLMVGPQKLGKGPHTAAHVCLEGVGPALFAGWAGQDDGYACADNGCRCGWEHHYGPGEPMGMRWPTPLIQITAFSMEQTENVYDALRPMITEGPLGDVVPATGEEFIRLPGGGRIDTVTSSAQSRLGQRVTFVPQDEVGIWTPLNKMDRVARTQWRGLSGMGGRASMTTNAWDPAQKSVAQVDYTSGDHDIYIQFDRPPSRLRFERHADRRRIYAAVYPSDVLRENGGHIDLDAIDAEAESLAKRDPAEAARFYGNILVPGKGKAVDPEHWDALAVDREVPPGTRVGVGFDGSISEDCTALVCCTDDGHLFVPVIAGEPTIWTRPENAPRGWKIPRAEVHAAVRWIMGTFNVGRFLGDPPKWWSEIEGWSVEFPGTEDEPCVVMFDTNQPKRMAPVCDRFSVALVESAEADAPSGFTHDGHPVLSSHVLAMVRRKAFVKVEDESDGRVLFVFTKGPDGEKIDAGVAAVLAREAAMTMPVDEEFISVYEDRGFLVL
jgi:hypothetical protein